MTGPFNILILLCMPCIVPCSVDVVFYKYKVSVRGNQLSMLVTTDYRSDRSASASSLE